MDEIYVNIAIHEGRAHHNFAKDPDKWEPVQRISARYSGSGSLTINAPVPVFPTTPGRGSEIVQLNSKSLSIA